MALEASLTSSHTHSLSQRLHQTDYLNGMHCRNVLRGQVITLPNGREGGVGGEDSYRKGRKYWVSRYINGGSVECGVCGVSEYCLANPSNPAPSTFRYELTTSTWYCPIHLPAYQTNVDEEGEGNKGYVGKFTVGNGLQGNLHCAECGGEVECEVLRKAKMEVDYSVTSGNSDLKDHDMERWCKRWSVFSPTPIVSLSPPPPPSASINETKGVVGIWNLGNTCFLSSALQCVRATEGVAERWCKGFHDRGSCPVRRVRCCRLSPPRGGGGEDNGKVKPPRVPEGPCLACAFDEWMGDYYSSLMGYSVKSFTPQPLGAPVSTGELITACWGRREMDGTKGYRQHDSTEWLLSFLNAVSADERVYCWGEEGGGREREKDWVNCIFGMGIESEIECLGCGGKRGKLEEGLSVEVAVLEQKKEGGENEQNNKKRKTMDTDVTLESLLGKFTESEKLATPLYCDTCKANTETRKRLQFRDIRNALVVAVKRFDAYGRKITTGVKFPLTGLDMDRWCVPSKDGVCCSERGPLYDLYATINHTGSLNQGHYTANVKGKVEGGETWFHCDDGWVGEVDEEEVEAERESVYALFYRKRRD